MYVLSISYLRGMTIAQIGLNKVVQFYASSKKYKIAAQQILNIHLFAFNFHRRLL